MDLVFGVAATLVGVFLFLQGLTFLIVVARLVKMRVWEAAGVSVARGEPLVEQPVFDAARAVLEREGFVHQGTRRRRQVFFSPTAPAAHADLYYNSERDVRAEVVTANLPTQHNSFDIFLGNSYTDGSHLVTVDGLAHVLCHYPSSVTLVDVYAGSFQEQLAAHLAARDSKQGQLTPADQADAVSLEKENGLIALLEQDGKVYRRGEYKGEPLYGFRLREAIRMAWRMRVGSAARARMDKRVTGTLPEDAAAPRQVAQRIAFVRTLCALNGHEAPRWFRWSAFVLTASLFLALGVWLWDLRMALVIGAVIVVHEAGHWLAMKCARFRDVQVFFVPGMGGATSGEKHDASPLTHLAVYLAGPLPGIVLALCALAWLVLGQADPQAAWYAPAVLGALVALFINMLNLLPVMPLDGGRIIDLFALGRLPWLRFVFVAVSVCVLLWAGVTSGDNILLGLGIVTALAVPHQFRVAALSRHLLRRVVAAPQAGQAFEATAEQLFDILSQPAYERWNYNAKVSVGQSILPHFMGRLPTLKESALGLTIYVASIALPLAALAGLAFQDPQRVFGFVNVAAGRAVPDAPAAPAVSEDPVASLRAQRSAMLASAGEGSERRAALIAAIDDASGAEDVDDELRLARLLYRETGVLDAASFERADAMARLGLALQMDEDEEDDKQALEMLAGAEAILRTRLARENASDDALLLARLLERQPYGLEPDRQIALWEEIVSLRAAHADDATLGLPRSRVALARALDAAGREPDALAQLDLASSHYERVSEPGDFYRSALIMDRAWFHFAHGRGSDALLTAAPLLARDHDKTAGDTHLVRDARMLAAIEARSRGDWKTVDAQLSNMQRAGTTKTGLWFSDSIMPLFAPVVPDVRVTLLLIEAQRAMGKNGRADSLLAQLRDVYRMPAKGGPPCRFVYPGDPWRKALGSAVTAAEKRELRCVDRAG